MVNLAHQQLEDPDYNPGLSFGQIPHLRWSAADELSQRRDPSGRSFTLPHNYILLFCRCYDFTYVKTMFHLKNKIIKPVFPDKIRFSPRGKDFYLKPSHWDLWLFDTNWSSFISIHTISVPYEIENKLNSEDGKIEFMLRYGMKDTLYPLFKKFYDLWSPKSSLRHIRTLESASLTSQQTISSSS